MGKAWCSQHEMAPGDCFDLHNPQIKKSKGALTPEQHEAAIVRKHIKKQRENFERALKASEESFTRSKKG